MILVGFMGAGKTSVGRALSQRLGWAFRDLDDHIRRRDGRAIDEIFRQAGESGFRKIEHAALQDLLSTEETAGVIALGGGAFVQKQNTALLQAANLPVIFLDAPVEELFRRCQVDPVERPLRTDLEQFRALYETRKAFYMRATRRIETGGRDIEQVAAELACSLGFE